MHAASRLSGLPELTGVRKIWFSDWYDGPITGVAEQGGREYWFVMVTNDGGETWDFEPRISILHQISAEQLAGAWDVHRGFVAAGIPGCLHSPPCAATGETDHDRLAALWEEWPPEREAEYMNAPAIGWFRDE